MAGASVLTFPDDEEWPHLSNYSHLDPSKKQIRLLLFEDDHDYDGEDLRLMMCHATLAKSTDGSDKLHATNAELLFRNDLFGNEIFLPPSLQYHALSYCWGKAQDMTRIFVDGEPVFLRQHLVEFLQNFRSFTDRHRAFWLDVLCINQKDLEERNQQVSIMSEIFSSAQSVIAWLGPPTPANQTLYEYVRQRNVAIINHGRQKISRASIFAMPEDVPLAVPLWVSGMEDWTLRSFWTRLWIVQECALAENLFLMSGSMVMKFEILVEAQRAASTSINRLSLSSGCRERVLIIDWLRKNIHENGVRYESLLTLMQWFDKSECRDPRDAVYALLSLSVEKADVNVDYSKSPMSLWWETFQRCQLQAESSLGVYSQERNLRLMARLFTRMKRPGQVKSQQVDLLNLNGMASLEVYSLSRVSTAKVIYEEEVEDLWPSPDSGLSELDSIRTRKFFTNEIGLETNVVFPWHGIEKNGGISRQALCASCKMRAGDILVSLGSSFHYQIILREPRFGLNPATSAFTVEGCAWQHGKEQVDDAEAKDVARRWCNYFPSTNDVRFRLTEGLTIPKFLYLEKLYLGDKWHELGLKPIFLKINAAGVYSLINSAKTWLPSTLPSCRPEGWEWCEST